MTKNALSKAKVLNNLKISYFTIALLLISLTTRGQNDYLKYPSYDDVISKFFNKYSVKKVANNTQLNFEKRPDGWHITLTDYSERPKKIKDELFWDRKKNKFQEIDFEKLVIKGENREQIDLFQKVWNKKNYNISPYFGYPGWDWDVINDFKDATNLPDSILYGLGRAYSSYASNLINNNSGFSESKHQFYLPQGKNAMTKEQLEKYRFYRKIAIEKFVKLSDLNPNFETAVGSIGIKASNEYLTSFLDLRTYQNEEEAQKEIIPGLYNEYFISTAKNYLNSCAPNAILLTYGDNDTYPLLYVQSMYGFRTDVLVVNMSLLQTERYINSLRNQILDAPGLPISLKPDEITGDKRQLILIEKDLNPIELSDLMTYVKNDNNRRLYNGEKYYNIPSNKFRLNVGENFVEWETNLPYIYRNKLIILDLLATNKWARPVYFTTIPDRDFYFGLDDYLKLEGLAYRLSSTKKESSNNHLGSVNTSEMFSNMMTKFEWKGFNAINPLDLMFYIDYRSKFNRLATALIEENKPDSAVLVLDKCIATLTNEIVYFDYYTIPLIENYYKLNEFEKANKIAKLVAHNHLHENIDPHYEKFYELSFEDRIELKNTALERLRELALDYDQQELLKILDK